MSKMSDLAARSEMMMMGYIIPVNNDEVLLATEYILNVLHCDEEEYDAKKEAKEAHEGIFKYSVDGDYHIKYMVVNTVMQEFVQITYIIEAPDQEVPEEEWRVPDKVEKLAGHDYFSYVYNVTAPDLSELGYTFYDKGADGRVHRVG